MRVIPNQTFIHDAKTYEEGQSYDVPESEAAYFQQAGWVGETRRDRRSSESLTVTLNVRDIQMGHAVRID